MNLAVGKLPRPAPGEFRFVTKAIQIEPREEGEPRRFKMIASSTVVDEGGDEIKMAALEQLRDDFSRGLNIFTDHVHKVDNVFGRSDTATILNSGETDPKTGAPIFDLHVAGVVNEPDPRMVRLADSIDGGYVTFGASIGARVTNHKKNKAGGMDIYGIQGKEASLVGIPMNQRSWTYKAAKAAKSLDDAPPPDEDDEEEEEAPTEPDTSVPGVEAAPETPEEAEKALNTETGAALQRQDLEGPKKTNKGMCPDCGGDHDAEGCDNPYHTQKSEGLAEEGESVTEAVESDGQESAEADEPAETPETASAESTETDPADEQKALVFEEADVVVLAMKARDLAQAVVDRDAEIETLKAENTRLTAENEAASQVIERLMAQPLRRKTIEPAITKHLPSILAPEVRNLLTRTAGDEG